MGVSIIYHIYITKRQNTRNASAPNTEMECGNLKKLINAFKYYLTYSLGKSFTDNAICVSEINIVGVTCAHYERQFYITYMLMFTCKSYYNTAQSYFIM